jgi:carbon storage regulator
MLVLSRKEGQSFDIGSGIVVTLLSIRKGKAKIGVTAPREVPIARDDQKRGPRENCRQAAEVGA